MQEPSSYGSFAFDRSSPRAQLRRVVVVGVVLAVGGLSVSVGRPLARGVSRGSSLMGRLTGFPAESRSVLVDVEAVSLRNGTVEAVAVPVRARYSMSVARGPYLVVVRVLHLRSGRTVTRASRPVLVRSSPSTVNLNARTASANVRARAAKASGPVIGIGEIPITIDIPGYRPGGGVDGGIINGLLPSCQADGGKLVDVSKEVKDAMRTEQKLSDEGRTAFKFQLDPLAPSLVIQGQVNVDASGKPVGDFKVIDPKTGKVVDHIVVGGDPGGITDLGPFLRLLGKGIGSRACKPKPKPKPKPSPPGGTSSCSSVHAGQLCFVFDGSGSVTASYPFDGAKDASGTETWHMVWKEPLQTLRISGGPYPPQAGSTATGHVVVHYDQRTPHPDCTADMSFDPSQTAETLYDSFSYTGQDRHSLLLVGTAPMFRLGASGSCPGISGPVDAETRVLHPPVGFNTGAFEQFQFTFSDRPGIYRHTYGVGEHEFTGGGYHGSWTGTMTVRVGK